MKITRIENPLNFSPLELQIMNRIESYIAAKLQVITFKATLFAVVKIYLDETLYMTDYKCEVIKPNMLQVVCRSDQYALMRIEF
jgi:hypothetical protein